MQGSLGHCPELVEVKFFFLVQLAEMSKKELLTLHGQGGALQQRPWATGGCEDASLTTTASATSNSLPKQKTPEGAVFLIRLD